jgi:uncharacterized membrane protein YdjX (TVP38/TMEM64 family)
MDASPPKPKLEIPSVIWVYLGILAALIGVYLFVPPVNAFANEAYRLFVNDDRAAIQDFVSSLGVAGPLLLIGMMIAQTIVTAIPMIVVLIVSVVAYGPVYGGLIGWFGAILAALLGYGVAKSAGASIAERMVTPQIRAIVEKHVERYGAWAILALRLSPLVPSDSVSFVAGLVKMRFSSFLLATIGGVTPVVIAVAYFGSSFERLRNGIVVVTAISLGALVAFIVYDQWKRRARG